MIPDGDDGARSPAWASRAVLFDLALLTAVAAAGVLTAGTLVDDGTTPPRMDWRNVQLAWIVCWSLAGFGLMLKRRLSATTDLRRRPLLMCLLVAALVWTIASAIRPSFRAGDGLVAQYYANAEWTGAPVYAGPERIPSTAQLIRRWGGAAPATFSVNWTGFLTVGRSGSYHFATTSDDGSWLYVDDQLVVDNGGVHGAAPRTGDILLTGGSHRLQLKYVQLGGESELTWSWAGADERYTLVPSWALSRRRARYGVVLAARIFDAGVESLAIAMVLASAWYVGVRVPQLATESVEFVAASSTMMYRSRAALAFSMFAYAVILSLPRDGWALFDAVVGTTRDLNNAAVATVRRFDAFQAAINTPHAGERQVLPDRVVSMVAMLNRQGVNQYHLSDAIAADPWVFQQMVASAWPRTLEAGAKARFLLDGDPVLPGCTVVDRQGGVSLVRCP